MSDEAKPHAILVPHTLAGGGDWKAKNNRISAIVKPIFGLKPTDIVTRFAYGDGWLVYPGPNDPKQTAMFPTGHELAGQERFVWTEQENGIKLGTLVAEPTE